MSFDAWLCGCRFLAEPFGVEFGFFEGVVTAELLVRELEFSVFLEPFRCFLLLMCFVRKSERFGRLAKSRPRLRH